VSTAFGDWATAGVAVATLLLFATALWAGSLAKREIAEGRANVEKQIRTQHTLEAQRRVFALQSTLNSREFVEMSAKLVTVVRSFPSDSSAGVAVWKATLDLDQMVVLAVLNFYELVASEYNAKLLDREVADMNLAYTVVRMWDYVNKLVTSLRLDNPAYFDEWEHLYVRHGPSIRAAALSRAKTNRDTPGSAGPSRAGAAARSAVTHAVPESSEDIHLPGPTILPLLAALGITLIVIGTTVTVLFSIIGLMLLTVTTFRWITDTRRAVRALPLEHLDGK
jgi:hypothetical protein